MNIIKRIKEWFHSNCNNCKCYDPRYETTKKIIEHKYEDKTYKEKGKERIGAWCIHCEDYAWALKYGNCIK